ncbi:MAG: hypothetical protein ACYS26_08905 [Planctomycetota bacterium]|jgi:hypothetical protein
MKKTILLSGHSPHFVPEHADSQLPWEDVDVKFHRGRKERVIRPCVCGIETLRSDLSSAENEADKRALEQGLQLLQVEPDHYWTDCVPGSLEEANIYSGKGALSREDVERVLAAFLRDFEGLSRTVPLKFVWKRTDVPFHPVELSGP